MKWGIFNIPRISDVTGAILLAMLLATLFVNFPFSFQRSSFTSDPVSMFTGQAMAQSPSVAQVSLNSYAISPAHLSRNFLSKRLSANSVNRRYATIR